MLVTELGAGSCWFPGISARVLALWGTRLGWLQGSAWHHPRFCVTKGSLHGGRELVPAVTGHCELPHSSTAGRLRVPRGARRGLRGRAGAGW